MVWRNTHTHEHFKIHLEAVAYLSVRIGVVIGNDAEPRPQAFVKGQIKSNKRYKSLRFQKWNFFFF